MDGLGHSLTSPTASEAFRAAGGDAESRTVGTMVDTTSGWREMRLSVFARRKQGRPAAGDPVGNNAGCRPRMSG